MNRGSSAEAQSKYSSPHFCPSCRAFLTPQDIAGLEGACNRCGQAFDFRPTRSIVAPSASLDLVDEQGRMRAPPRGITIEGGDRPATVPTDAGYRDPARNSHACVPLKLTRRRPDRRAKYIAPVALLWVGALAMAFYSNGGFPFEPVILMSILAAGFLSWLSVKMLSRRASIVVTERTLSVEQVRSSDRAPSRSSPCRRSSTSASRRSCATRSPSTISRSTAPCTIWWRP